MKKLVFSASLIAVLLLAACGGEETKEETPAAATTETATNDTTENEAAETETEQNNEVEESTTDEKEVVESEIGKNTIEYKNKELNQTFTAGPINGIISAVQIGTLEINENYRDMFSGQEIVTVVTVAAELENTVDDNTNFYFNQARLTTDTGQQVESEFFLSDNVGGEFLGKVKLSGNVIWTLKHDPNITKITMHINGPSNSSYDSLGEDFTIEIPVK